MLVRGPMKPFSPDTQSAVGSGLLGEGVLGEVTQDSLVEVGESLEFSGGEQVDEMAADVVHVLGRGVHDGAASGGQKADQDAAGIGGGGLRSEERRVGK